MDLTKCYPLAKRIVFLVGFGVEKNGHRGICGPEKRFLQTCQILQTRSIIPIVIYPYCGRLYADFKKLSQDRKIILVDYTPKGRFRYYKILYQTLKQYSPHAIHCQGPHLFDLIAAVLGKWMNVQTIITRPVNVSQDHLSLFKKIIYYSFDQIIARNARDLIAISNTHKAQWCEELTSLLLSRQRRKVKVIYNGIFLNQFFQPEDRQKPPPVIFTISAQLTPIKGHALLLRVVHQLKIDGFQFLVNIMGDGPLRYDLESMCKELEIDSMVHFHGHISCVTSILKDTHVVVLPSFREGLSLALLEGMAMGCPLIASNVGASHELVENGKNGFLVEKKSNLDLYLAMKWFLEHPSSIQTMGNNSLEKVMKFDIYRMFDAYRRLYMVD
jgi:glycosyltransferase involved in cell wall biosynthesis